MMRYSIQLQDPDSMDAPLEIAECCRREIAEAIYKIYAEHPDWATGYTLELIQRDITATVVKAVAVPWKIKNI